jgi:hypothetical protein
MRKARSTQLSLQVVRYLVIGHGVSGGQREAAQFVWAAHDESDRIADRLKGGIQRCPLFMHGAD